MSEVTREVDCPRCHQQCGWCSDYRWMHAVLTLPGAGRRCTILGMEPEGDACPVCAGSRRVIATTTLHRPHPSNEGKDQMTDLTLQELKAIAERANNGSWQHEARRGMFGASDWVQFSNNPGNTGTGFFQVYGLPLEQCAAFAEHIATFDPPTVLNLISQAEAREEQHAIVARIWEILGSPSYEELAGRSIYDLIQSAQAEIRALRESLEMIAEDFGDYAQEATGERWGALWRSMAVEQRDLARQALGASND